MFELMAPQSAATRRVTRRSAALTLAAAIALFGAACTSGDGAGTEDDGGDLPLIVATTNIWADVVENVACDGIAEFQTVMPPGADPHTFEPSLRDRATMSGADLVVANGLGLEVTLEDTLHAVEEEGIPVFHFGDHVDALAASDGHSDDHSDDHDDDEGHDEDDHSDDHDDDEGHDEDDHSDDHDSDEGHDEDDHSDDHDSDEGHDEDDHSGDEGHDGHDHAGGLDPHIWFDPVRVAEALPDLAAALSAIEGIAASDVEACLADYSAALDEAHHQIIEIFDALPPQDRTLVTNHDSFGYFADRYGFRVVGTVIPAATTAADASIAHLERLTELIADEGVPAIFSETTHDAGTAESIAAQLGNIDVVTLATGSLTEPGSPAGTYIGLLVTNAETITEALQSGS